MTGQATDLSGLPAAVSGGYLLRSQLERAAQRSGNPGLPTRLVTASDCLSEIGPGPWALEWASFEPAERVAAAAAFGIRADAMADVMVYIGEAMSDGRWGWPNLFLSIDAARDFRSRFHVGEGPALIGISLDEDLVAGYLDDHPLVEGYAPDGRDLALRRAEPPAPGGRFLGYEILGEELGGGFHSWHCHDFEPDVQRLFGVTVNKLGLISRPEDARRAAAWIDDVDTSGAAPIPWRPWQLRAY